MPPKKRPIADWSWAGTTVRNPEDISSHHRRLAANLVPSPDLPPCPREYETLSENRARSRSNTSMSSDVMEVDRNGKIKPAISKPKQKLKVAGCTAKGCRSNPWCYNHLGADKVMDPEGKQKYIEEHAEEITSIRDGPAGLRNLGATCYANAFLQLWFHNITFRNGVYACVTSEVGHLHQSTPLYHLASVFAMLQHSQRAVVDPSFLIEALRLDKGDQQDAGEFSKLFMNVLEGEFKKHPNPNLRTFMKHQFEGTMQYVTRCDCGYESRKETTFLELEVSLKDKATLQECLDTSFAPEDLIGDNQYHCPVCMRRRDATRRQQPAAYPPVVHISLMRFMYDYKTMARKKVKASISYPKEIQLGQDNYELRGVIIHHGATAHRGHFTCEVWDEAEKTWLLCNDEEVTEIDQRPPKRMRLTSPNSMPGIKSDTQSSKDAYMLVYQKRDHDVPPTDPPDIVSERVWADNIALENEGSDAAVKRGAMEDEYLHLNRAKRDSDHIVPRDALKKWLEADTFDKLCEPFDMSPISCSHGGVDPRKASETRLISEQAFDTIALLNNLPDMEICPVCVEEEFKACVANNELQSRLDTFNTLNEGEGKWIIPAAWLDRWESGDLVLDTLPTNEEYTLHCEHGERAVQAAYHRDRRKTATMTDEALMLLRSIFGDFPVLKTDQPFCYVCQKADEVDVDAREARKADIAVHRRIKKGIQRSAQAYYSDYYSLPSRFVEDVDEYIAGRRSERPQLRLLCEHGELDYDPEKDDVYLLTSSSWDALCEMYGVQEPVLLSFGSDYESGKRRQVVNERIKICEECRRKRLLDWEIVSIPIKVYQDDNRRNNEKTEAKSDPFTIGDTKYRVSPGFPPMNGFNRTTNASSRTTTARSTRSAGAGTFLEFKIAGVTKSTSVKELKVDIMRQKKLSPISQRLTYNGRELDKSDETMESIGYLAGDEIRLEELEEGDEDEIMDGDMDDVIMVDRKKANGRVEGFGGTALLSRIGEYSYDSANSWVVSMLGFIRSQILHRRHGAS
ncbi:hypothetical protein I316_06331 [Kwoniella heveanensis BCC8398]|uniref:ubiquitinyl hydrolase 1 n=1 Tax=Kwoniella heveanensis BCC8398 TaxID=1296120 RepID=A0A1B9GLS3_9TREE|nr:hypothetical protein I316_06331 [Kwoniella heveanensis BCC8398]